MSEPKISSIMQDHADRAVALARKRFRTDLDYTPHSLTEVDRILDLTRLLARPSLLKRLLGRGVTDEQVREWAKIWGGYVGEVTRRRFGGSWRTTIEAPRQVRVMLEIDGARFDPLDHVERRLRQTDDGGAVALMRQVAGHLDVRMKAGSEG